MYLVKIITKYNTIKVITDNVNSPQMQEIINQPYVEQVYIETLEHYDEEEKNNLLRHCVGMAYNTDKVLKMTHFEKKQK